MTFDPTYANADYAIVDYYTYNHKISGFGFIKYETVESQCFWNGSPGLRSTLIVGLRYRDFAPMEAI